jgi:hypothetical protein
VLGSSSCRSHYGRDLPETFLDEISLQVVKIAGKTECRISSLALAKSNPRFMLSLVSRSARQLSSAAHAGHDETERV